MANFPIDYEYLKTQCKTEGISFKEVSKLLGHSEQYLSYKKTTKGNLPNEDVVALQELLNVDMKKLIPSSKSEDAVAANGQTKDEKDELVINNLITKIGELENKIARLEERLNEPVAVSIPMNAKDMAIVVMESLLEGGWCTKDDVLREFNKHHIPIEHISAAVKANNAIAATSGVADKARTFYIKQE